MESNYYYTENKLFLKEKKIFDEVVAERSNVKDTLNNKIKYAKLTYYFKSENRTPISSNVFIFPLGLKRIIKDGSIELEKAKEHQAKFKSNLNETIRGK